MSKLGFNGKQEGGRVTYRFVQDGKEVVFDRITPEQAEDLIRKMTTVQRSADEYDKANRIIGDCALLQRAGVPLGLSSHPKILAQVGNEAAHNRDLRRYLPGGVKSQEQFGMPTIRVDEVA